MFANGCFKLPNFLSRLQLERIDLVYVERLSISEDRDYDSESHRCFGGGYGHHDEDKQLAADVPEESRERNKRQVDGVQHQLDTQEYRDRVALYEDPHGSDGKEQSRDT